MAMSAGNVVVPDKMQFPGGGGGGNEIHRHHQWLPVMDERDGFISWLRGEFAAANAIIDSLCHHLRTTGEPGEYDLALGCIDRRRCNWHPVLHMQQFFPIGEVIFALQQVASRKQQHHHRAYFDQGKLGKEFKRSSGSGGFNKGQRGFAVVTKEVPNSNVESRSNGAVDKNELANVGNEKIEESKFPNGMKLEDKGVAVAEDMIDAVVERHVDSYSKKLEGTLSDSSEADAAAVDAQTDSTETNSHPIENQNGKSNTTITPKTFFCSEIIDGKSVNVVDGLKLYEQVLDALDVSKLVFLINDLRAAGRKGQFQGQTYVISKRPMKGRGREIIQLGHAIVDAPLEDENTAGTSKDRRTEPIPTLLQDVIERLASTQLLTMKPDSCIIDVFNEGDHSQPYMWPPWFAKPVSVLFLTECDVTVGRMIVADRPGDYRGSLKLNLQPGSLLLMQGKSSDFAKYALPGMRKQRILITFAKSQPRKFGPNDKLPSTWGSQSRSPNHIRHPGAKHYPTNPATGVLPVPAVRPPPTGSQPLFVPASVVAPMPFPTPVSIPPVSTAWHTPPLSLPLPRHPAPPRAHLPVPGTGVFLPPGSPGDASSPPQLPLNSLEANFPSQRENGQGRSNHDIAAASKEKLDMNVHKNDCNGILDGKDMAEDEKQHNTNNTPTS